MRTASRKRGARTGAPRLSRDAAPPFIAAARSPEAHGLSELVEGSGRRPERRAAALGHPAHAARMAAKPLTEAERLDLNGPKKAVPLGARLQRGTMTL